MKNIITAENLDKFAYTNENECPGPYKAVVLEFHGLGFSGMVRETPPLAQACTEQGVLYVFPYCGPWCWMNDTAVKIADAVVEAGFEKFKLPQDTPVISTGGSMGGLSALIYTRYAKRTPAACAANCPVCDLPFHFTERDDLPRTLYYAFAHYDCDFDEALKSASPLHQADKMPDVPYYIAHGDADQAVNKQRHSDRFVAKMRKGHTITYDEVPEMGHCDLKDEALKRYRAFIFGFAKK